MTTSRLRELNSTNLNQIVKKIVHDFERFFLFNVSSMKNKFVFQLSWACRLFQKGAPTNYVCI